MKPGLTRASSQLGLFWEEEYPPGFHYYPEILSETEELSLLSQFFSLKWQEVRMHGVLAKRRVIHFGKGYEFDARKLQEADPIPDFLKPFQKRAAHFLKVPVESIAEILVTHYPVGAPIGWHRDAPMFESLFGLSLGSSCTMKLRSLDKSQVKKIILEPRSGYSITGEARWMWQHHIPPQKEERYSITFRTLKSQNLVTDYEL